MSKTNKENSMFFNLHKDDIVFDVINPRFAGMDVSPEDPMPYGDRLEEMYASMVETYKSTGSLLLQNVGTEKLKDGRQAIRFGYTRSMAYYVYYDKLCQELGVERLTIPAQRFRKVNIAEALVENLQRADQHFMSIAYAIEELRRKKQSYKSLSAKLGMSIERIKGLEVIPTMYSKLQLMCHDNIITEKAAVVFANAVEELQKAVAKYIDSQGIQQVHSVKEAELLLQRCFPKLHHKTPTQAFTALNGKQYPMIVDEDWVLVEGDLMNTIYVLDEKAEARRIADYYKMIAEQVKVWEGDRWKIIVSDAYVKCEMGTHPSEIAVWSNNDDTGWLDFYVKRTELMKVQQPEEYIQERKKTLEEKADNKVVNLKNKAKVQLMREMMDKLEDPKGLEVLHYEMIKVLHGKMNKAQKEKLNELMGKEVVVYWDKNNLEEFDSQDLLSSIGFAMLYGEASVYKSHRQFFHANGIDFNKDFNEYYNSEVREEVEEAKSKLINLGKQAEDVLDDHQIFVQEMHNIIVLGTTLTLREYLSTEEAKEPKYIKYIAKNLGMSAKGGTEIVAFRLNNAVSLLEQSFEVVKNSKEEELLNLLERLYEKGKSFDLMFDTDVVKTQDYQDELNSMLRVYIDFTGRTDVEIRKSNITELMERIHDGQRKGEALVEEFLKTYCGDLKKDYGYQFVYLKNGKKVSILG